MSYQFVDTHEEAMGLCHVIMDNEGIIGADIETTGLDWILDKILLLQLNISDSIYIVDVRKLGYETLAKIVHYMNASHNTFIFHNGKFDLKFLLYATKELLLNVYDTMLVEASLKAGTGKMFFSLADLTQKYTDYFMDKESRKEFINFPDDMPYTESMLQYSALDVKVLPDIRMGQLEELEKTFQTDVATLENKLMPIVAKMEYDGIKLNAEEWLSVEAKAVEKRDRLVDSLKEMIADFAMSIKAENGFDLAQKMLIPVKRKKDRLALEQITDVTLMRSWVKENFNVKSNVQMKLYLNMNGIEVESTNEKIIGDFAGNPIIDLLLEIRGVNKQIDSYGRNVIELIHPVTGKIHTEYVTVGTQTGRFSSNKPNMQNVPRKGGYRECFYPDEGFVFAVCDYSQQEYRLAGAISRDRMIIDAYKSGSDMHTATARLIFHKKPDEAVSDEERTIGKTVNFAILYGSTEYGLKNNLDIPIGEAKQIIRDFWSGYKSLSDFMEEVGKLILQYGFSSTTMGRRRYNLPKPLYMNTREFNKWEARVLREGRNFIIQGGGADMLKIAMVELFYRNPFGDKFRLCLQIHDELVAQVHESIKEEGLEFLKSIMTEVEQRQLGEIPAKVDGKLKERWSK